MGKSWIEISSNRYKPPVSSPVRKSRAFGKVQFVRTQMVYFFEKYVNGLVLEFSEKIFTADLSVDTCPPKLEKEAQRTQ